MENLKNKATLNIKASELLIKNGLYNPSVHCSYYGAFQLTMFAVCKGKNISLKLLDKEAKDAPNMGSHTYTINEFYRAYRKIDSRKAMLINNKIVSLKAYRKMADYNAENVKDDIAKQQNAVAKETVNLLNELL